MTEPGATTRAGWVDISRGVAVVMVVVHHSVMALDARGLLPDAVVYLNGTFSSTRMPLLFLVSGIFAGRALRGPWRVVLHKRVAHFAYLYVLWSIVLFGLYVAVPTDLKEVVPEVSTLLRWVVDPGTGLWFIYGLALFSVVVKLSWRVPLAAQLAVAGSLSVLGAAGLTSPGGFAWASLTTYFVFFLLGVRGGPLIRAAAERVHPATVVVATGLAGGLWALRARLDLHDVWGYHLVESAAFVAALVGICVLVERGGRDLGLRWLGARTLPVYLMHIVWIVVLTSPVVSGSLDPGPVVTTTLLPVLAAVAIAASVASHRALLALRAGWLFALPRAIAWRPPVRGVGVGG